MVRFIWQVRHSGYFSQTGALAVNSKPIYEVCDFKSEKSASLLRGPLYVIVRSPGSWDRSGWLNQP